MFSLAVAGSLLALAGVAFAQSATTGDVMVKSDTMMKKDAMMKKSTPKPMVFTISDSGKVLLRGTVKSVSTDSLTVSTWGGSWTVAISGDTEFAHSASLTSIVVGDFVGITGTITTESPTITAKYVRNWSTKTDSMMKKEDAMMKKEDVMMKKDDAMMIKDSMMKKADTLVLNTGNSAELGTYLVAGNGMTLYHFTNDISGLSTCAGECAAKWPPYLVSEGALISLGADVKGSVSTITRADGTLQVRYEGKPLYFWANDMKAGDTTGNNVNSIWFVVKP